MLDARRVIWRVLLASGLGACGPKSQVKSVAWTEPLELMSLGTGDCVVVAGGHVRCSGWLGALASQVQGEVMSLASGRGALGYPRCAVTHGGQVTCWGCDNIGKSRPPATQPIAKVRQVVVGGMRACALDEAGTISCWGAEYPSRDLSTYSDSAICRRSEPEHISRQTQFPVATRIAMTADGRLCALTKQGDVFCEGTFQPIGDPLVRAASQPPAGLLQPVPEQGVRKLTLVRAEDLVAGNGHFCALGIDGSVTCWDENQYGQAGAPTELCVEYAYGDGCKVGPHRVQLTERATALAAGAHHTCAILKDRTVACWGRNSKGALGFASDAVCHPSFRGFCDVVPQRVPGIHGARELALSKSFVQSWVLSDAGEVLTWPEGADSKPDPRRPIAVCQNTDDAWQPERLAASEAAWLGRRVRVRGVYSQGNLRSSNSRATGQLMLQGGSLAEGEDAIVDGQLTRFYLGADEPSPLGIFVYDTCLVGTTPSQRSSN